MSEQPPGAAAPLPDRPDDEELPGLAGERTEMAWSRSGLALFSATAAIAKVLLVDEVSATAAVLIYGLLGMGLLAWGIAMLHARAVSRDMLEGRRVDNERTFRIVTTGTATFGAGALVIALLHG